MFYELVIKPGESYQQFLARFDAAHRKLVEQSVELPPVARGYMLIKKLKLDQKDESMLLTATSGNMAIAEVVTAARSIFPDGRGQSARSKEVFQAELDGTKEFEPEDGFEVMDTIADDNQQRPDYEDEDILEAFDSYADIRRKMAERKRARGFSTTNDSVKWLLSGTVKGRIEQLKAKTKCHLCKKAGHWKRECPMKRTMTAGSSSSEAATKHEANTSEIECDRKEIVEIQMENSQHQKLWSMFERQGEPTAEEVGWENSGQNGVQNEGFADTHSTGNRQRSNESDHIVVAERREVLNPVQKSEVILTECLIHDVLTQECESTGFSNDNVGALGRVAVPDTACRRTLVGAYTLQLLESHLADQGLKTHRRRAISEFRFGNSETLISRECVILAACVGRHRFLIKASNLPGKGRNTPLRLAKEFLREMGSVLDMGNDTVHVRRFDASLSLGVTERGHYAMSLFEFRNQECLIGEVQQMKHDRQYDIQALERQVENSDGTKSARDVLPSRSKHDAAPAHPGDASECGELSRNRGDNDSKQAVRHDPRPDGGWTVDYDLRCSDSQGGQILQTGTSSLLSADVRAGQGLCGMGSESHHQSECLDTSAIQSVHSREGSQQTIPHSWRTTDDGARHEQRDSGDPFRATNDHDVIHFHGIPKEHAATKHDHESGDITDSKDERGRVHGLGARVTECMVNAFGSDTGKSSSKSTTCAKCPCNSSMEAFRRGVDVSEETQDREDGGSCGTNGHISAGQALGCIHE